MKRFPPVLALAALLALSFGPAAQAQGVPDTTAPTIDLRSPIDGTQVSRGAQVIVRFSCTDEGGSGLATCAGSVPDGASLDTSRLGEVSVTVTASDNAGNDTSATAAVTVVDRTAPSVDLRSPRDGAVYVVGEQVIADYDCADDAGGSGIVSCTGPVADGQPIDTSTPGDKVFTVEAVDAAGNSSGAGADYRVISRSGGFLWPVRNLPAINTWRAGALVPIRFEFEGHHGADVIAKGWPRSAPIACDSAALLEDGEPTVARYKHRQKVGKGTRERYLYLWRTRRDWAGSCRQFILKLSDGTTHRANFRFVRHWWEFRE